MLKDVFMAAKRGGPDTAANFLLRVAVEKARKHNVPRDNIEKAIKKAQGADGPGYEDITYEGYGPYGIAVFVEASTNNGTRTVANVKSIFKKCDGSLGTNGSVEFLFERKSVFEIPADGLAEEEFTLHMIDAGADDVVLDEGFYVVTGPMEAFGTIQEKLQEIKVTPEEASLERIPHAKKKLTEEESANVERLIELLEDDDDVVTVYHNLDND
jgi:YebC/PmpR family DNA-binding regulatory protein